MNQIAKGLAETVGNDEEQYELRPSVRKDLESLKWYLWHGNVFQALQTLDGLPMDVESAAFETKDETARKLLKQIEELHTYVERNPAFIPNYGERDRHGERIASGFCGVSRESGCEPTNGEAPTDAVDRTRRPPAAADPYARAE
jgi:hypothetical protein